MPEMLTLNEIAKTLKVSRRQVEYWIADGRIRRVKLGRAVRVDRSELERFVDDCRRAA
jgi:excisionase family DNA binding protein